MMTGYSTVTGPAIEPVDLGVEVKDHLRVKHTDEDALIESLIATAREWAENFTNRKFVTQTLDVYFDRFPVNDGDIVIPFGSLSSVVSVKYYDTDDTATTVATTVYRAVT